MSSIAVLSFLPANYGITALACSSTFLLHLYHLLAVDFAREAAKIPYPQFYPEKSEMKESPAAMRFACLQRAAGNSLEVMPQMIFGAAFSGLQFPIASGVLMGTWVLGKALFTYGYSTGDPSRRMRYGGGLHYLGTLGIMGLTFYTSSTMIHASLRSLIFYSLYPLPAFTTASFLPHRALLPAQYGWTALSCMLVMPLHIYQIMSVSSARRKAEIKYPQFYAETSQSKVGSAGYTFNCVQRAHMNTLELISQMLFATAFSGLAFPRLAAFFMGLWVVGRFLFTVGYKTGDPQKRLAYGGQLHYIGSIGVLVLGFISAGRMVLATL